MTDLILAPLQLGFMQNALLMALLLAVPCAVLSCVIVLKGWSLMGDAITHAVLPGLILAYFLALPMMIGAFIAALCCTLTTGFISRHSRIKADAAMGLVFSVMFALGLVLMSKLETGLHLDHLLYGDLLAASHDQLLELVIIAVAVLLLFIIKGRDIIMAVFDTRHCQVIGINTGILHYLLLATLAAVIVSALQKAGMILVMGYLIIPGAIALMLCQRFAQMVIVANTVAVLASFTGVYLSYYLDSAPAPSITLSLSSLFIGACVFRFHHNRNAKSAI